MFQEIIERIKSESPKLFVKLRWLSGVLAAIAGVGKLLISTNFWHPINLPGFETLFGYSFTAFTSIWGISFLPKKDPTTNLKAVPNTSGGDGDSDQDDGFDVPAEKPSVP